MVWNLEPQLLEWGWLEIRYYGVLFALGIILAYQFTQKAYERRNYDIAHLDYAAIVVVVGIIIGAHLFHLIFYEPRAFINDPVRIIEIGKGLASHGGLVGGMVAMYLYCRVRKLPFVEMLDPVFVAVPLAGAFVRVGNFFNSEILGSPTELPWGIVFAQRDNIARHPAQLYEALFLFLLFAYLFREYKKSQDGKPNGFFIVSFFVYYFGFRFFVEFVKARQSGWFVSHDVFLTMGQWLSIPVVAIGLYLLFFGKNALAIQPDQPRDNAQNAGAASKFPEMPVPKNRKNKKKD